MGSKYSHPQTERTRHRVTRGRGRSFTSAVIVVGFLLSILYLRHKRRFQFSDYIPLLAESTVYAVSMGSVILLVMQEVQILGPSPYQSSLLQSITVSAGAGVHEELIFRLGLISGLATVTHRTTGMSIGLTFALVVAFSSVAFSLAHYLGPHESFEYFTFAYRTLAGLIFSMLYLFRGFAVAVYTHFLYDVYVLVLS